MTLEIKFTEADLKKLIHAEVERLHGGTVMEDPDIVIEVKSKQNSFNIPYLH